MAAEAQSQELRELQKKMSELEKALAGAKARGNQQETELEAERSKTERAHVSPLAGAKMVFPYLRPVAS